MNHSTSVVLLRSGHHGGLGIVRSLGRMGVDVYSVDAARWEAAFLSRYCRRRFLLDTARETRETATRRLRNFAKEMGGKPLLIPTTDDTAIWVADHADALEQGFRFPRQDAALVRILSDKGRMQDLARRHGVPTAQV